MGGETIALYGGSSASTRILSPRESELPEYRGADAGSPLQIKLLLASTKGHDVILGPLGSDGGAWIYISHFLWSTQSAEMNARR